MKKRFVPVAVVFLAAAFFAQAVNAGTGFEKSGLKVKPPEIMQVFSEKTPGEAVYLQLCFVGLAIDRNLHAVCFAVKDFEYITGEFPQSLSRKPSHSSPRLCEGLCENSPVDNLEDTVAFTNNFSLFRVSHPSGSPQGYSEHRVDVDAVTCTGWPRGKWIYSRDTLGATEGGSSGLPITDSNAQVVGQLSGACGFNLDDVCDSESNATVDGAFANYYPEVEQWLNLTTQTCNMHVDSIVLSLASQGPFNKGVAEVTIVDEGGQPVSGATESGTFSGDFTGTVSAATDANGVATLQSGKKKGGASFFFCVDNVTHDSCSYDSGANVETCDSY